MSRLSKEPFDCIASTSQESHEEAVPNLSSTRTLRVTLLSSEWKSTKGGVSTINRELAIQLAKQPNVDVTVYLPECREDDRQVADTHKVQLIGAEKLHGLEPDLWLSCLPHHHAADCVIGHEVDLGRQVQLIQHQRHCKWIQVVHTDPEELGMFKSNADAIPKGEKQHQLEVKLCELSDQVVAVGPKLADAFSGYLRPFGKDQNVLNLTPGIFSEFSGVEQASEERRTFSVLVLGHGNSEDLQLKGYDIAAKAIAELKDNSQPYKLKVVGAPSGKEKQVAEMFLQQGIDRSQLVVRGFKEREQLAAQFCEVDLAIMPSRSEGFGLAALEALSAGLPVLVSGNSGLGEALKNVLYGTNCVVDSELPSDWAKAIRSIRQKRRDLRLKETKSICEEYANTYSWEEQCNLLVQRMRNLATGFPGGTTPASVMEHSQAALSTASEANRRSGTEGFPFGTQFLVAPYSQLPFPGAASQAHHRSGSEGFSGGIQSSVTHHSPLPFPDSLLTQLRSAPECFPGGTTPASVMEHSQAALSTASEANRRSGTEGNFSGSISSSVQSTHFALNTKDSQSHQRHFVGGFSGGGQSSVTHHSLFPFPESSHTQLRSAPEGFSCGGQSSATHHSLHRFPDSSQTQLRSAPEGFSIGSQFSLAQHHYPAFPAPSQGHLRSQSDGLSVGSQSSVAQYSHSTVRGAFQGFPVGSQCTSTEHHHSAIPGASQGHLRSGTEGAFGYGYIPSSINLSPGLSKVVICLKDAYRRRSLLKPLLWENTLKLPIEDVFTRLKIVSRRKTDFHLERNAVDMYGVFVAPDDVSVLVEGSPGIGKTTFCLKIAYDWANGKIPKESSFPEFNIVLLLKCRDMNGDVMDAIYDQLLPEGEKIRKELLDCIEEFHFQRKVLIILDGLDELPEMCKDNVDKLLHKKCLQFCYVLATSRQERGIKVRQDVDFDVLFQIEGFSQEDGFEYIQKHFKRLGPEHLSKGEKLIKAIKENSFLHALPSNPLNLLLLCVVFEDYEGKLPTRRTELYQIIVRCLLRRFCAKYGMQIPKDDKDLEEQFEKSLLTLGELAWTCLLEGRLSFREVELARFEEEDEDLFARILGLVFKEASLKKINPQHEYYFFHKTFQEYLAATYLALHLLKKKGNIFKDFKLDFCDVVSNYHQVFLFLSGILGEKAVILFRQIGGALKVANWNWTLCKENEATFFTESFSESGSAEQVVMALCSILPFPSTLGVCDDHPHKGFLKVSEYCKTFLQLQHPVHLTVAYKKLDLSPVFNFIASSPKLETLSISYFKASEEIKDFSFALSANSSLLSLTLKNVGGTSSSSADFLVNVLAASKTLATITLEFCVEWDEAWASALETGLSADTPLNSVALKIPGSMSDFSILALKRVLVHTCLTSIIIIIYGGIEDSLATAVAEGLAIQSVLESFSLTVYGRLSQSGLSSLERGFLQNCSLLDLEVKVFDEIPDNWATVVNSLISVNKGTRSCSFHPDIRGSIGMTELVCLNPTVQQTSFSEEMSIYLWGELSCDTSEALGKLLMDSTSSRFTVNIHGKVADSLASSLSRYVVSPHKTLALVTVNIWGELSRDGKVALEGLKYDSHGSHCFQLNVNELMPNYYPEWCDFFVDNLSSLAQLFTKLKNCRTNRLALTVSGMSEEWARGLGDNLTNCTSLTTLALTINNYTGESGCELHCLGDSLAKNTSLTTLALTVNYTPNVHRISAEAQLPFLRDVLVKSNSLTSLSVMISDDSGCQGGEWVQSVTEGLADNVSLRTLSLAIDLNGNWMESLGYALMKNTSLTSLTLAVNYFSVDRLEVLCNGLAGNVSLTSFSLATKAASIDLLILLLEGLKTSKSLTTANLKVTFLFLDSPPISLDDSEQYNLSLRSLALTFMGDFGLTGHKTMWRLGKILPNFQLLDTLTLTVASIYRTWLVSLGKNLRKCSSLRKLSVINNKITCPLDPIHREEDEDEDEDGDVSLTVFTLIINNCYFSDEHNLLSLAEFLAVHTSLTTFTLTLNNYYTMNECWMQEVCDGLARSTSLASFSLTVNNYGNMHVDLVQGSRDSLAKSISLVSFSLSVNNYGDMNLNWMQGLGEAVAKSESLTTVRVAINSCNEVCEDQLVELCNNLAKSDTLTTLSLTVNDHARRGVGLDLGKCFADCKSLKSLNLTLSFYGNPSDS